MKMEEDGTMSERRWGYVSAAAVCASGSCREKRSAFSVSILWKISIKTLKNIHNQYVS